MTAPLHPVTFADYRELARRRLIDRLFQYIDGGANAELTLRDNAGDLDRLRIRQRVLRDVSRRALGTTVLGQPWSMPLGLAPVGLTGMFRRRGEVQALRAAEAAGVPFTLSTVGLCSIEEVAQAATKPFWFQLYVMKDRGFVAEVIQRAKAARCSALLVTADLPVAGGRHRDARSGMASLPTVRMRIAHALDLLRHVPWVWDVAIRGRPLQFGTIAAKFPGAKSMMDVAAFVGQNFDASVTWKDIEWMQAQWGGPLLVKGVLEPDDAHAAVESGAAAVVVSNHGGRQLDSVPSSIAALPAIADRLAGRAEVLVDGGIRSGLDVFKALALGARAAMAGRAWVFPLAAQGQAGVTRALETMRRELDVAMALSGVTAVGEIGRETLVAEGNGLPAAPRP